VRERRLENGAIVWVVRYPDRSGGKHVDRSIYLGCEPLAKCAKVLIQQWRDDQITPEELRHRETVQLLDISAAGLGFSKRARIRLKDAAEAAKDDPLAMLELVYGHPSSPIRFGRGHGGRRGRGRLW